MALVTLENLARYDGNAKDRAKSLYASASAANWQKTEKAGAVTCYPVPETDLEPVVEFLFKETLPSGDKGPENPSVIAGVEKIDLYVSAKNMINFPYENQSKTVNGVAFTVNDDGSVVANGTATGGDAFFWLTSVKKILAQKGVSTYTSGCPSGGSSSTYFIRVGVYAETSNTYNGDDVGSGKNYTNASDHRTLIIGICIKNGYTANNLVFWPQVERNTGSTSYEKGCYAIYSINLPSAFYGGTLDVSTGKLTVTHRMVEPSSETVDISSFPAKLPLEYTDTFGRTVTSSNGSSLSVGSSGGKIVYRLAVPYSVYIDAVQIPSLPALDVNAPRLNTIYTDADSVQVGYQKHPRRTEEEIQNAILALGGNV